MIKFNLIDHEDWVHLNSEVQRLRKLAWQTAEWMDKRLLADMNFDLDAEGLSIQDRLYLYGDPVGEKPLTSTIKEPK